MGGWIKYEPRRAGLALKGQVSVRKGGITIALDLAHHFTDQKNVDKRTVEVYSDTGGLIGLRPGRGGHKPETTPSGALSISCKSAVQHIPIPHGVYAATWDEAEEILVFSTREGGP